jgi:hypothetical protein
MENNSNNITNNLSSLTTLTSAVDAYKAAVNARAEMEKLMAAICKHMLETFSAKGKDGSFETLQIDLGDGNPRGHIVVQRDETFFIRARNSGRPIGSKNTKPSKKALASQAVDVAVASEEPELVVEDDRVAEVEEVVIEEKKAPALSIYEQSVLIAEQDIAEQEARAAIAVQQASQYQAAQQLEMIITSAGFESF